MSGGLGARRPRELARAALARAALPCAALLTHAWFAWITDLRERRAGWQVPAGDRVHRKNGMSVAAAFGDHAETIQKQAVAILINDTAAKAHWLENGGLEASKAAAETANKAAAEAAAEAAATAAGRGRRAGRSKAASAPALEPVTDAQIQRLQEELWAAECENRFERAASHKGALAGAVTPVYVFGLTEDDQVGAFSKFLITPIENFVDEVAVDPVWRRRGVSYALFDEYCRFVQSAAHDCCDRLMRLQVMLDNMAAVGSYSNLTLDTWVCPSNKCPYLPKEDSAADGCQMMAGPFRPVALAASRLSAAKADLRKGLKFLVCVGRTGDGLIVEAEQEAIILQERETHENEEQVVHLLLTSEEEIRLALTPSKVCPAYCARRAADVISQTVLARVFGTILSDDLVAVVKMSLDGGIHRCATALLTYLLTYLPTYYLLPTYYWTGD